MSKLKIARTCMVHGCTKPVVSNDLCDTHRKRVARHGSYDEEFGRKKLDGFVKIMDHPLYPTWRNMERSAMGESRCERWLEFSNFVQDVVCKPDGDFYLQRIDTTAKFSLDNCFWKPIERNTVNAEKRRKNMAEWQRRARTVNPDYHREKTLKRYYGITLDDYNRMLESQGGVCKICNKSESRKAKTGVIMNLHVDHCHTTNTVRGLLCHSCNIGLGVFKDSTDNLQRAIDYLREATC